MDSGIRVLVVDDDQVVRDLLRDYLGDQGYLVELAASGAALRAALEQRVPDVVLLDIGLPGEDGLSLARFLRERHDLPVIMISGADSAIDRIVGLEVGADDYLGKPFDPRELLARLKVVLRRYRKHSPGSADAPQKNAAAIALGRCSLDLECRRLCDAGGNEIVLTAMEFDLLRAFASNPNRPMTRDQLLNATQNRDWNPFDRSIDIRIARLRRKIEVDPERPQLIRTVRSVGYMLVPTGE